MAENNTKSSYEEEKDQAGLSNDSFLLTSYLDEVDDRIENLRRQAQDVLQERESLLAVLGQIQEDCSANPMPEDESQDLLATIDRLRRQCVAVDVKVHTVRSLEQEQAFSKVQSLIEDLERKCILEEVEGDEEVSKQARCFLNACMSDAPPEGPVNYKFQGMILDCKIEDQKLIRHRLECLVDGRCHEDYVETHIGQSLSEAALPSQSISQNEQLPSNCTIGMQS